MWTGDGDYDTWGRFVFTGVAIGLITLPIWILPYGIWYIFKGHKEEQKRKLEEIERKKKFDEYCKNLPPKPRTLFSSISDKQEYIRRNM